MSRLSLRTKLLVAMLVVGIVPLAVTLGVSLIQSSSALNQQVTNQVVALKQAKKQAIELYFQTIRDQVVTFSENTMIVQAMQEFSQAFSTLPNEIAYGNNAQQNYQGNLRNYYQNQFAKEYAAQNGEMPNIDSLVPQLPAETIAQYLYIGANPNPLGSKDTLDRSTDNSWYSELHGKYHPIVRAYLKRFGYYDIFLVEPKTGHIVYSVFKELDYGTSLLNGPYQATNFGDAFRAARDANDPNFVHLEDFKPYLPSYNAAASFISSPIFNGSELIGVLIFQMPVDRINAIMQQADGLGETGETFLVGPDLTMRSQSRFSEQPTILNKLVDHPASRNAIAGQRAVEQVSDSTGRELIAAYSPLEIQGLNWGIVSEIASNEAFAAITSLKFASLIIAVIAIPLFIALSIGFARHVTQQLGADPAQLQQVAQAIAEGNLAVDVSTANEPSGVFAAMVQMRNNLKQRIEADRSIAEENGRIRRALDKSSSTVMLADADYNIVYINDVGFELFKDAENDIREDFPQFSAGNLMGANIDEFHKNPSHQRGILNALKDPMNSQLKIGKRMFELSITPVFDTQGERTGTVVEWQDRTQEISSQEEVKEMVTAALTGDLSKRLDTAGKTGFFELLYQRINELVEVIEQVAKDMTRVLGSMSKGDLSQTMEADYAGVFGKLKNDVNSTVNKLQEVIGEVGTASNAIRTGAGEIAQGNMSLSQRTESQASSLEETAASMEQMTATVKQNADNASQADRLAADARQRAEKGGDVVQQAVNAMQGISSSSKKVADIISVIDEIAFQTNLLALNAAVEAARAGEQGRGFAVVASEVRNLAQRSAGAAKEIKDLIEDSVVKVDEGSQLVNASGETLEDIVNAVKKVSDIVAEISAASQEQRSGIEQVNRAVMQMDEMTQQNAALVEQAAAASEAMGEQAKGLDLTMAFFQGAASEASNASAYQGEERRSAERPWTGPESTAVEVQSSNVSHPTKTAATGTDDDWEEF